MNVSVLVLMTGLGLLTGAAVMGPSGSCWSDAMCRTGRVRGRRGGGGALCFWGGA